MTHVTPSKTLNKFLSIARLKCYQLPGSSGDAYIIGVSGGADSSVLAILLSTLFPDTKFLFVFTDTKQEVDGTYEALTEIENYTGNKVFRVNDGEGLYELIDRFNGFLPSSKSRYCTRIMKVEAMEDFMENLKDSLSEDAQIHNFVGMRADEPTRTGFDPTMPWMHSHFPMQDLGMVREDVFNILSETVGIPVFYRHKSRSGCSICPFQRQSELLGTRRINPDEFFKAESYEKLTNMDEQKYKIYGEDWSGIKSGYPIPDSLDLTERQLDLAGNPVDITVEYPQPENRIFDLFAEQITCLYVGIEYMISPMMNMFGGSQAGSPGTYHIELVGWSTSKGGISRKLTTQYWTRHDTCEAFDLTPKQFSEEYKQAIFVVDVPLSLISIDDTEKGSFSWRRNEPLKKIRQIASVINRTMHMQSLKDEIAHYKPFARPMTWECEHVEGLKMQLKKLSKIETGRLVAATVKAAPQKRPKTSSPENAPCVACSK